eukprot:197372_1
MSLSQYQILKKIGTGSFGSASICHKINNPQQKYVIKRINLDGLSVNDTKSAIQESELLRHLSSPCIVKYIDSFVTNSHLAIIMEYCDGGDLSSQVSKRQKSNSPFNENEIKNILYQICIALNHCHSQNILHRDVKTSNIFISTTDNRIKLGDFGVSRVLNTNMSMAETQIGTPYYISPEICKGQSYSFKSDIWSLGCVMYELINLHRPFEGKHIASLVMAITNAKYKPLRNNYSLELRNLVESMLSIDPKQRPLTEQILNHKSLRNTKRRYTHLLLNPSKSDEHKTNQNEQESLGLTAEYAKLQLIHQELPRISSSSQDKSSSEFENVLRNKFGSVSQPPEISKSKLNKKSIQRSKSPLSQAEWRAKKKAIKKMEKQQKEHRFVYTMKSLNKISNVYIHTTRKRAEMRLQRKKELREHIKKNRGKHSALDVQVDFVGNNFNDKADKEIAADKSVTVCFLNINLLCISALISCVPNRIFSWTH